MPINYELEKEIFFKNHSDLKIGDRIIVPNRSNHEFIITDICPKYLKIQREDKYGRICKYREYYTTNNKLKSDMRLHLLLTE